MGVIRRHSIGEASNLALIVQAQGAGAERVPCRASGRLQTSIGRGIVPSVLDNTVATGNWVARPKTQDTRQRHQAPVPA